MIWKLNNIDETLDQVNSMESDVNNVNLGSILHPDPLDCIELHTFVFNKICDIAKDYITSVSKLLNKEVNKNVNIKKEKNQTTDRLPTKLRECNPKYPPDPIVGRSVMTMLPYFNHNEAETKGMQDLNEDFRL
jgi:hypothetical protein